MVSKCIRRCKVWKRKNCSQPHIWYYTQLCQTWTCRNSICWPQPKSYKHIACTYRWSDSRNFTVTRLPYLDPSMIGHVHTADCSITHTCQDCLRWASSHTGSNLNAAPPNSRKATLSASQLPFVCASSSANHFLWLWRTSWTQALSFSLPLVFHGKEILCSASLASTHLSDLPVI